MCRRTGWKKEANAGEGGNDGETGKIWNTAQCCTSTAAGSNCEGGKAWGAPKYGESSRYMWLEACPRLPCTKVRTQNAGIGMERQTPQSPALHHPQVWPVFGRDCIRDLNT